MYKVNYTPYLYYGTPGPHLHGRYLFPVIGPIYVLAVLTTCCRSSAEDAQAGAGAGDGYCFSLPTISPGSCMTPFRMVRLDRLSGCELGRLIRARILCLQRTGDW